MPDNELERFLTTWNREAENTLKLLRALPASQYDFRPDKGGRSLGELAWHLAEGDAYMSFGIENGRFTMGVTHSDDPPPDTMRSAGPSWTIRTPIAIVAAVSAVAVATRSASLRTGALASAPAEAFSG